jgi:hypothetical protein
MTVEASAIEVLRTASSCAMKSILTARITLERDGHQPFAITCGSYGWMVHTSFFSGEEEA